LPLVGTPFEQLMLTDGYSSFAEAVALNNRMTSIVDEALLEIFSHVGLSTAVNVIDKMQYCYTYVKSVL